MESGIGPPAGSLLFPLPVCVSLSLCVSHDKINKILKKGEGGTTWKLNEILFSSSFLLCLEGVSGGLVSEIISPVSTMIPFQAQWCPVASRFQTPRLDEKSLLRKW